MNYSALIKMSNSRAREASLKLFKRLTIEAAPAVKKVLVDEKILPRSSEINDLIDLLAILQTELTKKPWLLPGFRKSYWWVFDILEAVRNMISHQDYQEILAEWESALDAIDFLEEKVLRLPSLPSRISSSQFAAIQMFELYIKDMGPAAKRFLIDQGVLPKRSKINDVVKILTILQEEAATNPSIALGSRRSYVTTTISIIINGRHMVMHLRFHELDREWKSVISAMEFVTDKVIRSQDATSEVRRTRRLIETRYSS